jgi:hypothetical protein
MQTLVTQDWRTVAFTTAPADRERAETGIRTAYTEAGLPAPQRFIWAPSPAFGAVAAALLNDPRHATPLRQAGLGELVDQVTAALADDSPTDTATRDTTRATATDDGHPTHDAIPGHAPADAGRPVRDTTRATATDAGRSTRAAAPGHVSADAGRPVRDATRAAATDDGHPTHDAIPGHLPAGAGRAVRDLVRTRPWEAARGAVHAGLGAREWAATWARTGGGLWEQVNGLVTRIRQGIGGLGTGEAESLLRQATLDAVLGQHDAPWLALFEAVGRLDGLTGLAETARAAGWWWPYERLVVVCERPAELHREESGRLHRGDGPALAYPDGFALHAWRGMPIPADFTGTLAGLTAERIAAEANAELRRVMLEHFGFDRYLAETGARPVHRDETGVLWRIELPGDEPVAMVAVVNSTPEPDGTRRTYHLRVPPTTRTAREGVAWTFGLTEGEYTPVKQT